MNRAVWASAARVREEKRSDRKEGREKRGARAVTSKQLSLAGLVGKALAKLELLLVGEAEDPTDLLLRQRQKERQSVAT